MSKHKLLTAVVTAMTALLVGAPSVYIGSCPAGHDVIDAGADQL